MAPMWLLYYILRGLMGVAALLLNLVTIVCVFKYRYLRSAACLLIANIALGDFLHGVLMAIILPIIVGTSSWPLSYNLCLVGLTLDGAAVVNQLVGFCLLALERRNTLLFQLNRSKKWNVKMLTYVVVSLWAIITTYNVSMAIVHPVVQEGTPCGTAYWPSYKMYIDGLIFFTCSIAISMSYGHIAWITYRSSQHLAATSITSSQLTNKKITKMLAIVIGVYCVLHIPVLITSATLSKASPQWHLTLFHLAVLVLDINFWINPLIYARRDKMFQRAFSSLYHELLCRGPLGGVAVNPAVIPMELYVGTLQTLPRPIPRGPIVGMYRAPD